MRRNKWWGEFSARFHSRIEIFMPPRRKPTTSLPGAATREVVHSWDGYRSSFVHYLESECGMARNTILAYSRDLDRFLGWLKSKKVKAAHQIDLSRLQDYIEYLKEIGRLAASSIARNLVTLKLFFRYLVLEGVLLDSVADLVNSPKLWQYLPHVMSPEGVNRLLAAPRPTDRFPHRDRAFLAILYATGCRVSEVANMQLRDLHLEERYCRALGKGNKERMVSLNPLAIKALRAYLEHERPSMARKKDPGALFLSRTGRALTRMMLWKLVRRYAQRIGADERVSPHTLRHSFATHMLAGGAEIRALQEMLGHASISTTQIYTHVEHSRLKSVHSKYHPRG